MIIAIDGPAGAGKGTIAGYLALKFNLLHLDTGLLYRALAKAVIAAEIDPLTNPEAVTAIARTLTINAVQDPDLRGEKIAAMASQVAVIPEARQLLDDLQRNFCRNVPAPYDGAILDGRDIGTVIWPEAPCKLFITARPEIRTQRRLLETQDSAEVLSTVTQQITERDQRDSIELAILRQSQLAPGQAVFVRQQVPLGLGHAVWCARHLVGNQPFAVMLADDLILAPQQPCLSQMIDAYQKLGGNVVAVMDVAPEHVNRYGILDIDQDNGVHVHAKGVVEKPALDKTPSHTAIVGRYILQPEIFEILGRQQNGTGGEIQLTDSFPDLIERMPFHGVRFAGQRFDCGLKEGWLEANLAFAYTRPDLRGHLLQAIEKHCK